ncbi:MAG TPA: inositol monophosphatase [Candidatus Alistipes excrementigallinarum]|nr:inositol monophosphatase [Candidatus Alistipes excrementigallinarum]
MFEEYLDFAVGMAREAGRIQLTYFRGDDLAMKTKSNVSDVVTRADRESEELIVRSILERYPTHAILGEEGGARGDAASEWRWVVDPLDGTTNYSQGLPVFCVSIALQYRGETVVGVVYAPYLRELFTAVRGGGAWCRRGDGEPVRLHVSTKQRLDCSVVATGFPYDKSENPDNNSDNVARILPHVRDVRRMGAAAYDLSCVAAAMLDGFWELNLHEWDVCAASLLVIEAGGIVESLRADRGVSPVAGSAALVEQMKRYVR